MEARLRLKSRVPEGHIGVLKDGLGYMGSRVIRAESMEVLEARAKAAERCDWWVTMNGSHVLIKGNEIVGGAGGRLNGKEYGKSFRPFSTDVGLAKKNTWSGKALTGIASGQSRAGLALRIESLGEAEAALTKAGFKKADIDSFKDLDPKLMVANINRVLALEARFGAAGMLGNASLGAIDIRGTRGTTHIAQIAMNIELRHARFQFNKKCYKDGEKHARDAQWEARRNYAMPCKSEDYPVYTATHEYGHLLQLAIYMKGLEKRGWTQNKRSKLKRESAASDEDRYDAYYETWYKTQSRCLKEIERIGKRKDPSFKLNDQLSWYGRTNYAEAFAEIFANSQCGAPNAAGEAMNIWLREKGFLTE